MWTKRNDDLGEPIHTHVPCWMPKPLPPRNQYGVGLPQPRNDHAQKNECADFFLTYAKKRQFSKEFKFDHSLVYSCLHLLFHPPKNVKK